MAQWSHGGSPQDDVVALEAQAARAGLALACTYANSAEFDAALIAARRAAGVYGPRRHCRQRLATAAGVAAGVIVLGLAIHLIG